MVDKNRIEMLKQLIRESENIVFFGGAGVSTESNIPDFRSADGLYNSGHRIPPEEILSRDFFFGHTEDFYEFYRDKILYNGARPNKAHYALRRLELQGKLKAIITQNIDGLHQMAGSEVVHELHGSVSMNTCTNCGKKFDLNYIYATESLVPKCNVCYGILKPDVVLYQEGLDNDVIAESVTAILNSDLLIVGGTSLVVYPAAGFIEYHKNNNIVLINKTETPYDNKARLIVNDAIGEVLSSAVKGYQHVIWDFDGTLFDTYPCMVAAYAEALKQQGVETSIHQLEQMIKKSTKETAVYFKENYNVDLDQLNKDFRDFDLKESYLRKIEPFDGALEVVKALKERNIKQYIVTHRAQSTHEILRWFGIADAFERVLTLDQGFKRKPDSEAFERVIEAKDIDVSKTLIVGDRGIDMMAGKKVKSTTCYFDGNRMPYGGEEADFRIDQLKQILNIV